MSYYNQQSCCCYQPPRQQQCCPPQGYNQSYSQSYSQTYNPCCNQSYTAQPQQCCPQQQIYAPPPPPPPPPMPSCPPSYSPPQQQQPCPYAAARQQQQQQQQQYNSGSYGGVETGPFPVDGYTPQPPQQFNPQNLNLPPPNMSCVNNPEISQGQTRYVRHPEQTECKNIDQCFNLSKTVCKDNIIHHQHNKNVIINVNRNHNHLLKVVNRDHNYHHHLINNIVKINDIHHQRIEQVRGEGRVSNDYKQVQKIEQPSCQRGNIDPLNSSGPGPQSFPQQSPPTPISFAPQHQFNNNNNNNNNNCNNCNSPQC